MRTIAEKIEERPILQAAGFEPSNEEREAVAQKIYDSIMEASAAGQKEIGFSEGNMIAERLIDELLDKHEKNSAVTQHFDGAVQRTEAEFPQEMVADANSQTAKAEAVNDAEAQTSADNTQTIGLESQQDRVADPAVPLAAMEQPSEETAKNKMPGAGVPKLLRKAYAKVSGKHSRDTMPAHTRQSLEELKKTNLPPDVKAEVKKLIKSGDIANFEGFVKQVNGKTFDWILKNRIGRWYYEALQRSGVAVGKEVEVPGPLIDSVEQAISDHPYLVEYPNVKVKARELISAYIADAS